jgi:uncharacterized caspase-like protein
MLNLGQLYELGRGVERDPKQALAWYRKASGLEEAGLAYQVDPTSNGPVQDREEVLLAALSPPSIQLLEPSLPQTRGIQVLYNPTARTGSDGIDFTPETRTIVGRVIAPAGLVGFFVDDVERKVDDQGIFRAKVNLGQAERDVMIAAIDRQGQRAERRLRVGVERKKRTAQNSSRADVNNIRSSADFGTYHALIIGNEEYRDLPKLQTAKADANAVAEVLRDRYGFKVKLIRDATRYDILSALNSMRAQLTDQDNLLVYYAGHGELDKVNMRGQWLPVDAERDSTANWISNVAITDILNSMNARHVMVVSDSCYSGALTRASLATLDAGLSDEKRAAWLTALASKRSRTALTSGGLAPVLDAGGGGHSVFARAFLDVLGANTNVLEGQRLFQELSARVTYAARNYQFEQLPQYAPIKFAGHEAGDFFLVPNL